MNHYDMRLHASSLGKGLVAICVGAHESPILVHAAMNAVQVHFFGGLWRLSIESVGSHKEYVILTYHVVLVQMENVVDVRE